MCPCVVGLRLQKKLFSGDVVVKKNRGLVPQRIFGGQILGAWLTSLPRYLEFPFFRHLFYLPHFISLFRLLYDAWHLPPCLIINII